MHSIDKGELARYLTIPYLMLKGAIVSIPTTENCSYDLLADFQSKIIRIQIKKALIKDDLIKINLCNVNKNTKISSCSKKYTKNEIDWLIAVDTTNNKFYILDYTTGMYDNRSSIWFRKNILIKKHKKMLKAEDFEY